MLVSTALLVLGMTAFGASGARAAEFNLRASHNAKATEPYDLGLTEFKKKVEELTGGSVTVDVFSDAQLGDEADILKSLRNGSVAVSTVANAVMAAYDDKLHVFDLPFIWSSPQDMYEAVDGPAGESFREPLYDKGYVLLGYFYAGERNILNNQKPINTLADLAGMKIRVQTSQVSVDAWQAFGANPTPIPYAELYTSLKTHVVNGAEAANTNYEAQKFYEVAPYWSVVGWQYLVAPLVMSRKVYDEMAPDQQKAVMEAAKIAVAAERKAYEVSDAAALEKLKKIPTVKINFPDKGPWIEASKPVWKKWEDVVGKDRLEQTIKTK